MEECQICGALVDILTTYHISQHGLTKDEYRQKYGTNYKIGIRIPKNILNEAEKYESSKCKSLR